jgi:multidrug resistance protein
MEREEMPSYNDVADAGHEEKILETSPESRPASETTSDEVASHDLGILVSWAEDDSGDPQNWSFRKKWAATLVVSAIAFISPASSSIVAPAAASIGRDLNITAEFELQIIVSVYILGYAVGPLFLSPLSEVIGRKWVVQGANAFFLAFNIGCGFAQNKVQLIVFRFLTGLGGSAPLSVGGGILADLWRPHERGRAFAIYALCPVLGPALGPIAGGFIAENTTWRWAFWATSIADVFILVFAYFYLQETYAPVLLKQRARKLTKETGENHYTKYDLEAQGLKEIVAKNLIRPFKLLATQIIIQFLAAYMSYLYGLLYIILTTYPRLWMTVYGEASGIGGLNYISISLGYLIGCQISSFMMDKIYVRLKAKNNGEGLPEYRLPLMMFSSLVLPVGLFWYGWSAEAHIHWIMPNIGAFLVCLATILSYACIQMYAIDSYGRFAASALAAISVVRSLCGFGFPLFAPYMYNALGYGWGNSLLAFVGIAVGLPAPIILWKWGAKLRAGSTYAKE